MPAEIVVLTAAPIEALAVAEADDYCATASVQTACYFVRQAVGNVPLVESGYLMVVLVVGAASVCSQPVIVEAAVVGVAEILVAISAHERGAGPYPLVLDVAVDVAASAPADVVSAAVVVGVDAAVAVVLAHRHRH